MKRFNLATTDLIAIVGFTVLVFGVTIGAAMIFVPAGFIAFGVLTGGLLLLYALASSRTETPT
jgi:hypothetical protein